LIGNFGLSGGLSGRKTYAGVNGGNRKSIKGMAIALKIGEAFIDLALIPGH
jgi:hypothetical protein